MTIQHAVTSGITRIRQPVWNEYAHLLVRSPGVWVKLVDPCSNLALGKSADHVDKFPAAFVDGEYEAWSPPSDYAERFGSPPE